MVKVEWFSAPFGFACYSETKNVICLSRSLYGKPCLLFWVLLHEFLHFLFSKIPIGVLRGLLDAQIDYVGFLYRFLPFGGENYFSLVMGVLSNRRIGSAYRKDLKRKTDKTKPKNDV